MEVGAPGVIQAALSAPRRRALEALRGWDDAGHGRGMAPREVAQALWPDSPAWERRPHHSGGRNRAAGLGATMPMNAAKILHRLTALGLAWQDEGFGYHISPSGRRALSTSV